MTPLLSILLPTYEYPEGIVRILESLKEHSRDDVEIIISDDSVTDAVAHAVAPFLRRCRSIRYRRNSPRLGACANWNSLVEESRGEYCLLFHHDEFPVSLSFPDEIVRELLEKGFPDILILGLVLVQVGSGKTRAHLPDWIRAPVARHAPSYNFFRNVIGPLSVVVGRRAHFARFDENLTWMIDVDAYFRLFTSVKSICFSKSVLVASVRNRPGSITASLGNGIKKLRRKELQYLEKKYSRLATLRVLAGTSSWARLLRGGERFGWVALRLATRAAFALARPPVLEREMRERLSRVESR